VNPTIISPKECRFCCNFEVETNIELTVFYCLKKHFIEKNNIAFKNLAPTCPDFVLDNSPHSRWASIQKKSED